MKPIKGTGSISVTSSHGNHRGSLGSYNFNNFSSCIVALTAIVAFLLSACSKQDDATQQATATAIETPSPIVKKKDIQNDFELLRTSAGYEEAKNDIQKSAIFNKANVNTDKFINEHGDILVHWSGKIDRLATSHGGKDAWVTIVSLNGVSYSMHDISASSSIYPQLSILKEGQNVRFTGTLQRISEGNWERSLTERGSLDKPEFEVQLETISALGSGAVLSPTMLSRTVEKHSPSVEGTATSTDIPSEIATLNPALLVLTRLPLPSARLQGLSNGNTPRNYCFLLSGTLALSTTWRDNGVPILRSQSNVDETLRQAGASVNDRKEWRDAITKIYGGTITGSQIEAPIRAECEKISSSQEVDPNLAILMGREAATNELCRGGLGDDPVTQKACQMRDGQVEELKKWVGVGATRMTSATSESGYSARLIERVTFVRAGAEASSDIANDLIAKMLSDASRGKLVLGHFLGVL